jgi:LPS-assembly protein
MSWYRVFVATLSLLAALSIPASLRGAHAAEPDRVHLDADKVSFEESTGIATAEGNVRMTDSEISATAPYLEYDSVTQQVTALSSADGIVTLVSEGKRLSGDRLDYNLATRRGKMTQPNGKVNVFYVKGREIEVMPASDLRKKNKNAESDEIASVWRGASMSTCDYPHPHYRLEARTVTVLPGKRMIIRRPKVYLGDALIFFYPFDVSVPLREGRKKKKHSILPRIAYESDKGVGLGMSGAFDWGTGTLDVDAIGWSKGLWEGEALITQEIGENLSAYAGVDRKYDDDSALIDWRPRWGLDYERNGWSASARWVERELLSIEKSAGVVTKYTLWRKPEINISSPWFDDPAVGGRFRVFGSWGSYEDTRSRAGEWFGRSGAGVQIAGEPGGSKNFQPFYNAYYLHYYYDGDIYGQQIFDATLGVRWSLGDFNFSTAYLRRWAWGASPMSWDNYDPREDIYQELNFRLPTGSKDEWWNFGLRASYSIDNENMTEVIYNVGYDQHCLLWEAVYRDDLLAEDDWFGLALTIKAFPGNKIGYSNNESYFR